MCSPGGFEHDGVDVLHRGARGSAGSPASRDLQHRSRFAGTSEAFTSRLLRNRIAVSMDGRGRAIDNLFVERLWRSVKFADIYLKDYAHGADVNEGLTQWFDLYTHRRPHQGLGGRTPFEVYHDLQSA